MNASTSVSELNEGSSCELELEEHIEEVRTRNGELSRLLTGQPSMGGCWTLYGFRWRPCGSCSTTAEACTSGFR